MKFVKVKTGSNERRNDCENDRLTTQGFVSYSYTSPQQMLNILHAVFLPN